MTVTGPIVYVLFRAYAGLCRRLPARSLAALTGWLAWMSGDVLRLRRGVVERQLNRCFPDLTPRDRAVLIGDVYRHLARTSVEIVRFDDAAVAAVRADPGWEAFDAALARGVGVIVASAHLGNFELGGRVLAQRCRLLDVVKPLGNRRVDAWLQRERGRSGIGTVTVDGAAAAVLSHLRGGGVVSLLLDQDAGAAGIRIPFLGHEASAWPGAARFSLQTGCPVVPMGIIRQADGSHRLQVGSPLVPAGRVADEAGIRAYTAEISAAVETFIRLAPEQWFWVHRRWKEVERHGPSV